MKNFRIKWTFRFNVEWLLLMLQFRSFQSWSCSQPLQWEIFARLNKWQQGVIAEKLWTAVSQDYRACGCWLFVTLSWNMQSENVDCFFLDDDVLTTVTWYTKKATRVDPVLSKVHEYVQNGWPSSVQIAQRSQWRAYRKLPFSNGVIADPLRPPLPPKMGVPYAPNIREWPYLCNG